MRCAMTRHGTVFRTSIRGLTDRRGLVRHGGDRIRLRHERASDGRRRRGQRHRQQQQPRVLTIREFGAQAAFLAQVERQFKVCLRRARTVPTAAEQALRFDPDAWSAFLHQFIS